MQNATPGDANALNQKLVDQLKWKGSLTVPAVEAAFRAVPRHLFLPDLPLEEVYQDEAIATKMLDGQFVSSSSQPAIMAIMLEQLQLEAGQRVLEIGAGTGYNAALMAHLVGETGQVVTIDIDEDIVEGARSHLASTDFTNVHVICADGAEGYAELAPYDRIILTVNASDIAPAWQNQLKAGGRLLLPLSLRGPQVSTVFEKEQDHLVSTSLKACGFVNLRGSLAEHDTTFQPGPHAGQLILRLGEPQHIDTDRIYHWLLDKHDEYATPIQVMTHELFYGLIFWLALHDASICNLQARGALAEQDIVPGLFYVPSQQHPARSTIGLLSDQGLSVLMRDPSAPLPADDTAEVIPFRIFIRSFGSDTTVANRLSSLVMSWHMAGRPTEHNLSIRAYPTTKEYTAQTNDIIIKKRWTQFVCSWKK
jgi:protein-L-isoaspartate(D-aspartate) O-methyltransferase